MIRRAFLIISALLIGHLLSACGGSSSPTITAESLVPAFGTPTRTDDGFTVQITNYDTTYTYSAIATVAGTVSGTVTVSGSGLVTVTGIAPNTSSTVTITTSKAQATPWSESVSATSLEAYLAYVSHSSFNKISVIDSVTKTVLSTFDTNTGSIYDLVLTPDGSKAYGCSAFDNSVYVIDTAEETVVSKILVGNSPFRAAVSPDGTKVYVSNVGPGADSVSVIDTATNSVVSTISLESSPIGVAVTPDGTKAYVISDSIVTVINTATNSIMSTISVGPRSRGATVTPDSTRLFVTDNTSDSVSIIDTATNSVVATVTGLNPGPFGVAFKRR